MSQKRTAEARLIGDIYDASLDPGLWPTVVRRIAELVDAEHADVLAFDRLNPENFLFHAYDRNPGTLALRQSVGVTPQDMEFACKWLLEAGGLGKAVANHQHAGGTDGYRQAAGRPLSEFFSRVGFHHHCGGLMEMSDRCWSMLSLYRTENGAAFADDALATVTRLMPHLRRALHIHRRLNCEQDRQSHLYRLLDGLTTGVLLIDSDSRVRYANARADSLLRQHDSLGIGPRQHLCTPAADLNTELQGLLTGAIQVNPGKPGRDGTGGTLACPDLQGDGMLMLTVAPLSGLAGYEDLSRDGIAAALFLTDPRARHRLSLTLLKRTFGLTDRESALCESFVNSPTLEGVAADCRLSLNSVRTYMKEIYAKTGKRSQAELMQLLMGLRRDFEPVREAGAAPAPHLNSHWQASHDVTASRGGS